MANNPTSLIVSAAAAALAGITLARSPAAAAPPTIHNLGTLGGYGSYGVAINDAGQVAGAAPTVLADDAPYHAFRYTGTPGSGGVMHDLGTLGGTNSFGLAINDSGQVAGVGDTMPDNFSHAFRYTGAPGSGGVMHDLGALGGDRSEGFAINNGGQVAGQTVTANRLAEHAFLYTGTPGVDGRMIDLGTLGGTHSRGDAINDRGQVAGWSHIAGNGAEHAFRYDGTPGSGGVMRDLGTLGGTDSYGTDMNDAGQVVGWSEMPGDFVVHAFLYTGTPGVDGRMIDLDAWLDANNPAEGAKWTLGARFADVGLNNNGQITGLGFYNDGPGGLIDGAYAFMLDASSLVPEPSGLALLALAVPALLRRRRRSRLEAPRLLPEAD